MEIKTLLKYIQIVVLTGVLFVLGLYGADRLVTPPGTIEAFYDEPKQTVDVLIVGGSHAMCALSPTEIYRDTGLTAYNLSTWSQPVWVSYHYVREALKYQSPKVVLIDAFGSFYDKSYLTGVDVDLVSDDHAQLMKPSLNLLAMNLARRRVQVTRKPWSEYLNIAKYHSRITELTREDFDKIFQDDSTTGKGFGPFYTTEDFSSYTYPVTDAQEPLYPAAEAYLVKLLQMLQEKDIIPVLVKLPHVADEKDIALVNTVARIAAENNVAFLDFCSTNALGLDLATDYADHGHLNYLGAQKATAVVAEFLNGLGLVPEHDADTEAAWQHAAAVEDEETTRMEIKLSHSFAEMYQRVECHGKTAMLAVVQDGGRLTDADWQQLAAALAETPFAMSAEELAAHSVLLYADGMLLTDDSAREWCARHEIAVTAGEQAEILYRGENHSYGRDGLNVALYQEETGELYHACSFAKEHAYTAYTE